MTNTNTKTINRVVVYDTTDKYLSPLWAFWAWVGRVLGIYSFVHGFSSWEEFTSFLSKYPKGSIFDLQIWGHGGPGTIYFNGIGKSFKTDSEELKVLENIIEPYSGLVWFRSCSVFKGKKGHEFAQRVSSAIQANVAAHTYIIGTWGLSSGLHVVGPGNKFTPHWDLEEGSNAEGGSKQSFLTDRPFIPAIHFTMPIRIVIGCLLNPKACRSNLFKDISM
jgi:hypothetical protein